MTRTVLTLLAFISMCHPALAQTPSQPLATFADKNRLLLIFAPTAQDSRLEQQLTLLRPYAADLHDRDLILILVLAQPGAPASLNLPVLSASDQLAIRQRFRIPTADFAAILLGKDGGEKLRSATPIPAERLNRTIDAMPMRRQEMRARTPKP